MRVTVLGERAIVPIDLDPAAVTAIAETRARITARTDMAWGEHCSECAIPSCYRTCSLYRPRADLKCRRFARGLENIRPKNRSAPASPLLRFSFLKWGKLEADGRPRLIKPATARVIDRIDRMAWAIIDSGDRALDLRREAARLWDRYKPELIERGASLATSDGFLFEAVNTGTADLPLTFTIRHKSAADPRFFQTLLTLPPGHFRQFVPIAEIAAQIDLGAKLLFQIEPAGQETTPEIIVALAEFVRFDGEGQRLPGIAAGGAKTAKCIVWDLDETLWSGTLIEDGPEGLRLNETARTAIVELDRRGILHSIASKNDPEPARQALQQFGLEDYFLHPQISWGPKSTAVAAIAEALNIGLDALVFIDDQPFERAEVEDALPKIRTLEPSAIPELGRHPWFDVPVTEEAGRRREMYRAEAVRRSAFATEGRNLETFLRQCEIVIDILPLSPEILPRVHELVQRTNQLNTSGNRRSLADLEAIAAGGSGRTGFAVRCRDRFGDYGIVAFVHFDERSAMVLDFCMSCRVQGKKVENAVFEYLRRHLSGTTGDRLSILYRKTERNGPIRASIEKMGFAAAEDDGKIVYSAPLNRPIPDAEIVTISTPEDRSRVA